MYVFMYARMARNAMKKMMQLFDLTCVATNYIGSVGSQLC